MKWKPPPEEAPGKEGAESGRARAKAGGGAAPDPCNNGAEISTLPSLPAPNPAKGGGTGEGGEGWSSGGRWEDGQCHSDAGLPPLLLPPLGRLRWAGAGERGAATVADRNKRIRLSGRGTGRVSGGVKGLKGRRGMLLWQRPLLPFLPVAHA